MKKNGSILCAALLFAAFLSAAAFSGTEGKVVPSGDAFLVQLQKRDSVLIADQLLYGVMLEGVEEGTRLEFPEFGENSSEGAIVLTPWRLDTVKTVKGRKGGPARYDIRAGVVVTSFDEGDYELPAVAVERFMGESLPDTLVFNPQILSVKTMPVDTATFVIHDIKGQIRYPLTFMEILPWLLGGLLLAAAVAGMIWAVRAYRRRKSGGGGAYRDPAHIVALRKLDGYRGDRLWAADKQKMFYSGVTDALREYICARYGLSAMEMTTKEIFDGLDAGEMPDGLYDELKSLFERADYVKFAKYVAGNEENASVVPLAVRFVTATYQEEVAADSKTGD